MLLCIDAGNTNTVMGVYDGERLLADWRISTDHQKMPDEYGLLITGFMAHHGIRRDDITGIALASVASCGVKILARSRNSTPLSVAGKPLGMASSRRASVR